MQEFLHAPDAGRRLSQSCSVFPGLSMSIRSPLVRFSGHTVQTIFRPEAPRRAAAGSETGLLFDFDDVPPNCFHVLADGAVVGRIMRVIQYRRRQVGVRSAGVCFLDPLRLQYCEHLRRAKMVAPQAVANAGLPIPQGKFKDFSNKDILHMVIDSLNEQFQHPMTDEVFAKVAWIYDRLAKQQGHPLSSALPRMRPKR